MVFFLNLLYNGGDIKFKILHWKFELEARKKKRRMVVFAAPKTNDLLLPNLASNQGEREKHKKAPRKGW